MTFFSDKSSTLYKKSSEIERTPFARNFEPNTVHALSADSNAANDFSINTIIYP